MREEAGGLILGPYEDGAPACYVKVPQKILSMNYFKKI